jgi:hypothetical protein
MLFPLFQALCVLLDLQISTIALNVVLLTLGALLAPPITSVVHALRVFWDVQPRYAYLLLVVGFLSQSWRPDTPDPVPQEVTLGLLALLTMAPLLGLRGLLGCFACVQGLAVTGWASVRPDMVAPPSLGWWVLASVIGYVTLFVATTRWRHARLRDGSQVTGITPRGTEA